MSRNAAAAGFNRLYHYERFNAAYLTDVLVHQRIHCSDPANLNDPWDCRPWFDVDALDGTEIVDEFIQWFLGFEPTSPVSKAEAEAVKNEFCTNPDYRRRLFNQFSRNFLKMIPGRWKVYCLTPFPDSTLMWSHYAGNHRGICLEFALDNGVFGSAQEVTYLSSYPKWAPHSLMKDDGPHVLLTKSDDWQYEGEYRVIALGEGIARPFEAPNPLILSGGFLNLPGGALQSVIVGCEADYDEIKTLVTAAAPGLKVRRAVRSETKYRLEIVE